MTTLDLPQASAPPSTDTADPDVVLVPLISFHRARSRLAPFSSELVDDLEFLRATGESWLGACARVGMPSATLERWLLRHGRHDLARKGAWA